MFNIDEAKAILNQGSEKFTDSQVITIMQLLQHLIDLEIQVHSLTNKNLKK